MGFHNNYLGFFKCFTGWPADTNNNQTTPPLSPCAWFQHGRETARRSRCTSSLPHFSTTPNSSRGDGILQIRIQTHVAIGIHWYPRDWDLGTYRSWWLGIKVLQGITPTGSRKNVKKTFQPTRLVQCMLDMWTPGSLANVKLRYLCSFLFFHESEFAPLRPLFIILHILSWDVRMFHAITSVRPKGNILHSIQKFVSSFSPSVTFNYLYVSDFSRFFMSILWMVEKSCNPP